MSELDYELAEMPSLDIVDLPQTESKDNEPVTDEVHNIIELSLSDIDSPEIIEVSQIESEVKILSTNELVERRCPEILEVPQTEESEVKIVGEVHNFKPPESTSDLEEGEIKELDDGDNCIDTKLVVCKYFHKGVCWLGKNCRFLHIGVSSYKMFDSKMRNSRRLILPPMPVHHPILISQPTEEEPPDSWDKGLREAKKLLLRAKLKKEADLDFEEKQLYQDLDNDVIITNKKEPRKIGLANKHKKRAETPEKSSRQKNSELRRKPPKTFPKKQPCSPSPKKIKLRTRHRSNSWSPVPSRHHESSSTDSSSSCSDCKASYISHKSENDYRKTKSKLERVFSRTFDANKTSRSRKPTTSRHTYSSHSRRRSLSRHSFIKRFIYRSYSKSPSPSKKEYPKKRPERDLSRKLPHKKTPPPSPEPRWKYSSLYSEKERTSPFSKLLSQNYSHRLESCSSDMTVSSIECTSASSEENKSSRPSKSPVNVSRRMSDGGGNDIRRRREHESSRDIKKWVDNVPKSTKGKECHSEISKKTVDKKRSEFHFETSKKTVDGKGSECHSEISKKTVDGKGSECHSETSKKAVDGKGSECHSEISKKTVDGKGSECHSEISKKTVDGKGSECYFETSKKAVDWKGIECHTEISKKTVDNVTERSSKPDENGKAFAKPVRKQPSSSDSSDEELSADELELLRYIPTKNRRKPEQKQKKAENNVKVTKPSTKPTVEHLPPKIVYDYGSDTSSTPPKVVHDYGSNEKSLTPKAPTESQNVLDRATNEDNLFPKESNNTEQVNGPSPKQSNDTEQVQYSSMKKSVDSKEEISKQINENGMKQKNDFSRPRNLRKRRSSESSSVERQLSAGELELLKYVSIRHPAMSEEIKKLTRKNPPLLAAKNTREKTSNDVVSKRSSHKSAGQKKSRTTEMSRREQLIQQLEAVELAIAKKKKQTKLEYAKLRNKRKSLN